tara:strand:- start:70 stop:279 length:210 start_codon:yes stop_codon:yes gene_type:complete
MCDFYYLLGEDADDEVTLIAERRDMGSIEEEFCKEAKGDFKNLRIFHLTNDGRRDDRMYLTRSEWVAIN